MAARNFSSNKIYNQHVMPVMLDAIITIGASGAPTIVSAPGIKAITRLATGQYRVQLEDNYNKLLDLAVRMQSPVTGSDVAAGSLSVGTVYQITALGTTTQANWVTAGVPSGITAAVGVVFKCAATSSGTGTAKALGSSNIINAEIIGNHANMLNNQPFTQLNGGFVDFQTMGPSFAGSALATHAHDLLIKGGQAAAGTDAVSVKAGPILGKESATDATVPGSASATNGGVLAASAGTPAGTVSMVATDPTNGSKMFLRIMLSNSSVR